MLKKFKDIEAGFTITTADEEIKKFFEPRTPPVEERIKALDRMHREGIKTYVMIAPLLPGAEALVSKVEGKIDYAIIDKMNYHYADWVYRKYNLEKLRESEFFIRKGNELAELLEEKKIPCRMAF